MRGGQLLRVLGLALLVPGLVQAVSPSQPSLTAAFSLTAAWQQTLENAPALQSSAQQTRAARATARAQAGALLPQVAAGASWSDEHDDGTPTTKRTPHTQNLTLTQPITLGQELAAYGAARASAAAAAARQQTARNTALLTTTQAYLDNLVAVENVSQSALLVKALQARLKASQKRFEFGEDTRTNVAEAQARLASAEAGLAAAEATRTAAQNALARALGQPELVSATLAWPRVPAVQTTLNSSTLATLAGHPAVLAATYAHTAAKRQAAGAGAEFLPELSARASYSRFEDSGNSFQPEESRSVGLHLSVPLFTGGATTNRYLAARAEAKAAQYQAADATLAVREELENALARFTAAKLEHAAAERALAAQTRATEGTRKEYLGGERSLLDVLDAEEALKNSGLNLARARAAHVLAATRLQAAWGDIELTTP